jgi:hypothetical protein
MLKIVCKSKKSKGFSKSFETLYRFGLLFQAYTEGI